jgi:hypothetical protein
LYSKEVIREFDEIKRAKAMEEEKMNRPPSAKRDPSLPDPNKELVKW